MATLGQRLREEREKRGLKIADLAEQTRIHARYFEAIERDDTESLPGGFFYRSFVRQYARMMGLPEEAYRGEIERSLEAEAQKPLEAPERRIDVPPLPTGRRNAREEAKRWAVRVTGLVGAMVACTGLYMGWERWKASEEAALEAQQARPVERAAPKQEPPARPPEAAAGAGTPEGSVTNAAPAEANAPAAEGAVRVIVRASELTWVGVWQGQKLLFGDLMRPGEVRGFGGDTALRVRLGNAGGVRVEWNGQAVPELGPRGQVRTVEFRPDGYEVIQPAARPAEAEIPAPDGI